MRFYMEENVSGCAIRFGDTGIAYVDFRGAVGSITKTVGDPTVDLLADGDILTSEAETVRRSMGTSLGPVGCSRHREFVKRLIEVANIEYHIRSRDVA